jgi:hypothetical protein
MNTSDKPVDLSAENRHATDWKVTYGDRGQFKAYFDDQARAQQFAAHHAGVVIPLGPV